MLRRSEKNSRAQHFRDCSSGARCAIVRRQECRLPCSLNGLDMRIPATCGFRSQESEQPTLDPIGSLEITRVNVTALPGRLPVSDGVRAPDLHCETSGARIVATSREVYSRTTVDHRALQS